MISLSEDAAAERERCARLIEAHVDVYDPDADSMLTNIAAEVRDGSEAQ